jgi:hypothetical protein
MGLELSLSFPKEKSSLTRQREREGRPESSTIARLWSGGGGGVSPGKQTPLEYQMLTVTFLGSLSQFGTTYTNLGSEEIGSLRRRQNVTLILFFWFLAVLGFKFT